MCCRATVLYDRAPKFFRSISLKEKHDVGLVFYWISICYLQMCSHCRRIVHVPDVMLQELAVSPQI